MVRAPIANPCREHTACGMISPNTTIPIVAPTMAIQPLPDKSSIKMVRVLLTSTLPNKMVHNKKLPLLRNGEIALAYFFSLGEPQLSTIRSSFLSRDMRPRLRPLKRPERQRRMHIIIIWSHRGNKVVLTGFGSTLTANPDESPWWTQSPELSSYMHKYQTSPVISPLSMFTLYNTEVPFGSADVALKVWVVSKCSQDWPLEAGSAVNLNVVIAERPMPYARTETSSVAVKTSTLSSTRLHSPFSPRTTSACGTAAFAFLMHPTANIT